MTTVQQQYKIREAVIGADRFGGFTPEARTFDIKGIIDEVTLYETLDKPYVTGNITVVDDIGLFEGITFTGTEKLRMRIDGADPDLVVTPPGQDDPRTYILTGIEKIQKNPNGNSSMYAITIIDEHAFLSRSKKISKSYEGNIGDIVTRIARSEIGKGVDKSYTFQDTANEVRPVQENMKVIVPNLTPIEAIDWLTNRATTETGSPYFMWASIHDNNLRFGNLDTMLKQKPFNGQIPFTYNPANVATAQSKSAIEQSGIIKSITFEKMSNTLKLVEAGSHSAEYANTNLNTGQISKQQFNFNDTLTKLGEAQVIRPEYQNVFDPSMAFNDVLVNSYPSKKYHTLTSTGVYGSSKSYHDEFDRAKFKKKLESRAIVNHLFKNMMNIVVQGTGFFASRASVGDICNVQIASDNSAVDDAGRRDTVIDLNKSGNCLIYDVRHTFVGTTHTVSMNVCKLESETIE